MQLGKILLLLAFCTLAQSFSMPMRGAQMPNAVHPEAKL